MKRIRIGKDISVILPILTNGQPTPLEGRDIKVQLSDSSGFVCDIPFAVIDNTLQIKYYGTKQKKTGIYTITVWENYGKPEQTVIDYCNVFQLVDKTCKESGVSENGLTIETLDLEAVNLELGIRGDSAYQIWLSQGNTGSVEDFLLWIKQPALDAAEEVEIFAKKTEETLNTTKEFINKAEQSMSNMYTLETSIQESESQRSANELARSLAENARIEAEASRNLDFDNLKTEIEEKNEQVSELTTTLNALEQTAEQNEAIRISSEKERAQAERNRIASEQERLLSENERKSNEQIRILSEDSRIKAESERKLSENERALSETIRAEAEIKRAQEFATIKQNAETSINNAKEAAEKANEAIASLVFDTELSATSENAVQNQVITNKINESDIRFQTIENQNQSINNILTYIRKYLNLPIASYRCYDKTNEDEDRSVLKDLTGNGYDIQLYNFAFSGESGYGKYKFNFNDIKNQSNDIGELSTSQNSISYTFHIDRNANLTFAYMTPKSTESFKIKTGNCGIIVRNWNGTTILGEVQANSEGTINGITDEELALNKHINFYVTRNISAEETITIEQIPDYRGALVSDGVDDYGLCENFPIFTKEKGYTVFSIDENLENHTQGNGYYISNSKTRLKGAFLLTETGNDEYSWGAMHKFLNLNSQGTRFNWQNTIKRNGISIESGEEIMGEDVLYLFTTRFGGPKSNVALYALEIYDHDLSDEEIEIVKTRMIKEYEEKTGNKYEEIAE